METNYTLKRLKLFWPVLALLMLSTFLVNAQVQLSAVAVEENTIVGDVVFCDVTSATVTGSRLTLDGGLLEITSNSTSFTTATITIRWQWSPTGLLNSWQDITTNLPSGVTATPAGIPNTPYEIMIAEVDADVVGRYDLEVTTNQSIYFRRVVDVVTNDLSVYGSVPTESVHFTALGTPYTCEENFISVDGLTTFCATAEVEICGDEVPEEVCIGTETATTSVEWWSKTPLAQEWTLIVDEEDACLVTTVTETTLFQRRVWIGGELCYGNTVTITVADVPEDLVITGTQSICLDQDETNLSAVYDAVFTPTDGKTYANYTYNWFVLSPYGTFIGAGTNPNQAQVSWVQETPNATTAYVRVVVTDKETLCTFEVGPYYVDISRQPLATAEVNEDAVCLTYDAENEQYVGIVKLEAEYTTAPAVKQGGTWSSTGGMVAPIFMTTLPTYTQGTYEAANIANQTDVWAVIVLDEDADWTCLDLEYNFTWTEYGAGSCSNDDVSFTKEFTLPHNEWMTAVAGADEICATNTTLVGNVPFCYDNDRTVTGTWTADPAAGVTFVNANNYSTTVNITNYGTYEFTWTIDDGVCATSSASVEVTFFETPVADAGPEQEVCNAFNSTGTWTSALLKGVEPTVGTGEWSLVSKPSGANHPTFPGGEPALNDAKAQILVTSFGRYEFMWTVTEGDLCSSTSTTAVDFYPGIKDVAVVPAEFSVCSLSFGTTIRANRDAANLTGINNLNHSIKGTITVQKRGTGGWENHAWDAAGAGWTVNGMPSAWSRSGAVITVNGANQANINQGLTFNMGQYGEYRLVWNAYIANKNGSKIITPEACEASATGLYNLYWKPSAILVEDYNYPQVCKLSKWTGAGTANNPWVISGGTPVTLRGSDPFQITTGVTRPNVGSVDNPVYEWRQDAGAGTLMWNRSRVSWSVEKEVSPGVWGAANWTTVKGQAAEVYVQIYTGDNEYERGKKITAWAFVQGNYRFIYKIDNLAGGCSDIAYQDIYFLQEPDAGDNDMQEICGFLEERENDCEGWNPITRFVGTLDASSGNTNLPTINGYWSIDLDAIVVGDAVAGESYTQFNLPNAIGYSYSDGPEWQYSVNDGTKYVRHDWIKIWNAAGDSYTHAYTINPTTGAPVWGSSISTNAVQTIEVSRHGIFPFVWTAENPKSDGSDAGGCDDVYASHIVYFKNTPLARDITPIRVNAATGEYLGMDMNPFDDCYDCDSNAIRSSFYMLERPIKEQKHTDVYADKFHELSGGFHSTIPSTQSVRWYTTGGAQEGAIVNKPIEGGTIVRTYALTKTGAKYFLVHNAPLLNFNKHHIVEIVWNDEPKGKIVYEEENTITECLIVNEFTITKVAPQVITGVTPVPAFTSETGSGATAVKHVYTVGAGTADGENPIPGAVYEWSIDGDDASYIYATLTEGGVWKETEDYPTAVSGEGLYKIHVYWGAGQTTTQISTAHGLVHVQITNSCHAAIAPFRVDIIENTFAGQLKYWNEDETYIPTPYKFHPSNNFDYFYVHLYDVTDYVTAWKAVPANAGKTLKEVPADVVEALDPRIKKIMVDPDNQSMQSYFEFKGLDVTRDYLLRVVDGGFYHLQEAGAVRPNDNFLSFTYTWNRWDGIGVNAADAMAIMQMSAGADLSVGYPWVGSNVASPRYGFFSNAIANVDGSPVNAANNITLTDAFHVLNRFVGTFGQFQNNVPNFQLAGRKVSTLPENTFTSVGAFSAGNANDLKFVFGRKTRGQMGLENNPTQKINYAGTQNPEAFYWQSDVFKMTTSFNKMNLYLNASGDINSRYSVPGPGGVTTVAKSLESGLSYAGIINAEIGDEVIIPVRLDNAATLGAISLGLNYNNQLIEVLDVNMAVNNINHKDGFIRVAEAIVGGRSFGQDESVLNIRARVIGNMDGAELFTLQPETQFHSAAGEIVDVTLNTNFVSTNAVTNVGSLEAGVLTIGNYPNPFRSTTTIEYTLPESGNVHLVVYNNVGQVVATLVNETQQAGLQSVVLNSTDLGDNDGMFIYRISVEGQSRTYLGTGNLMLVK